MVFFQLLVTGVQIGIVIKWNFNGSIAAQRSKIRETLLISLISQNTKLVNNKGHITLASCIQDKNNSIISILHVFLLLLDCRDVGLVGGMEGVVRLPGLNSITRNKVV